MPRTIDQAQPPLEFIPPAFDPTVQRVVQLLLPAWTRFRTSLSRVEAENVERLAELYHQFQAGKVRLLLAFRHPSADDPICLAHLLYYLLPKSARQAGIPLKHPVHVHFIYDRGIPLWAGDWMGWLYSRLGGTPICRGKIDRAGLRSARDLFVNGRFPLAAAPEGATNGHNEIVSPLEPGLAQMGFWCVEDLLKAGRSETVLIVPIGIQYRYEQAPWPALARLLSQLEADAGLDSSPMGATVNEANLYRRLYRLGEHVLAVMEGFYTRFYHQTLPAPPADLTANEAFAARLQALLNAALSVAEQYFNLPPKGSVIDRCRRLEQAGWDYIYREDLKPGEPIPLLERGLADRIAEEADLRLWHMRLVESFVAVTGKYVQEKPTVERFAETTLLMWDMMTRIKGDSPFNRPSLGKQWAKVTIGQPISVSERWDAYQGNRRAAKQAIADLTQDMQTAMERMIDGA